MGYRFFLCIFVILWVALAGCAGSPPSRFYMVNSLPQTKEATQPKTGERCITLGIGPINVPAYVDRPQIVTRISPNELQLAEFHNWAEPLKDSFARVLVENLTTLVCTKGVFLFPWKEAAAVDYQIILEVIRFEGKIGETALLVAQWSIFDGEGREMIVTGRSYVNEKAEGQNVEALVAAQSRALADLSRQIASAIEEVSP
ncbi:membrane integrity-associated transporter subunit PqiC [Thermodesulfobacteriota bacterium]